MKPPVCAHETLIDHIPTPQSCLGMSVTGRCSHDKVGTTRNTQYTEEMLEGLKATGSDQSVEHWQS